MDREGKANAVAQQEQLVQLGKLQSEEEQHNNRIKQRDALLGSLAHLYKWDQANAPFSSNKPLSMSILELLFFFLQILWLIFMIHII